LQERFQAQRSRFRLPVVNPRTRRKEDVMRLRILLTTLALVVAAVANGGYGWGP
jgi:hypothetical protein